MLNEGFNKEKVWKDVVAHDPKDLSKLKHKETISKSEYDTDTPLKSYK